jgi:sodium-dependent dicarboxylate transporter 2/3/5
VASVDGRFVGRIFGPLLLAACLVVPSDLNADGMRPAAAAGVALWMAAWWLTEAAPIWITALLPLVLWPLLGVYGQGPAGDTRTAVGAFLDGYLLLFFGGMVLGAGMEERGLHRRIALHVLAAIGTAPRRLLLGVLVATAGISMWISNTATAVMMMPIALALVRRLEEQAGVRLVHFGGAVLLGVAWAANVGGIGTKIGTGTNSIFCGFLADRLDLDLGFLAYVAMAAPFVVIFLPILWLAAWLTGRKDAADLAPVPVGPALAAQGRLRGAEAVVAACFGGAALLWIGGDFLRPLVTPYVPPLWEGFKFAGKHWEGGVAMLAAASCWALGGVSWRAIAHVPWSVLLLLGGSFALASGIEGSGLSAWMGARMRLADAPLVAQVGGATAASVLLSAFASNTATINVLLNVLPPRFTVLAAAAFGASCDFALPAGTPPNAIVFGSGYVRLPVMMRSGFALDAVAIVVITVYATTWINAVAPT